MADRSRARDNYYQQSIVNQLTKIETSRRHKLNRLRTDRYTFQKLYKDRVDEWCDQRLGQRYALGYNKCDSDYTVISSAGRYSGRTALLIEGLHSMHGRYSQTYEDISQKKIVYPDIQPPKLIRRVVYSVYGGKLIYISEDPKNLYDKVRLSRIQILNEYSRQLDDKVKEFITRVDNSK